MIRYIERQAIDSYWPIVSGYIESAIDHACGELELHDIYQKLHSENMGLVTITESEGISAACVVEFIDYPQKYALRVVALGGEGMKSWLPELLEFLDRWAEENDMDRIEQMGRDGWIRVLNEYGYQKRYTFMTKDFNHG